MTSEQIESEGGGAIRLRLLFFSNAFAGVFRSNPAVVLCILFLFGFLVHYRCLFQGYTADDYDLFYAITRDDFSLLNPFPAGRGTYFRPAVMATLFIEDRLGGGPFVHHLVNLGLHFAAAVLLFLLLRVLGGHFALAACLSGLFLVHRASIPATFWISGRVESLLAVGYLTALLSAAAGSRGSSLWLWTPIFTTGTALALLSKESGVTIPLALLGIHLGSRSATGYRNRAMWILMLVGIAAVVTYSVCLYGRFYASAAALDLAQPVEILRGFARSIILAVVPVSEWGLHAFPVIGIAAAGAAVVVGLWSTDRRHWLRVWGTPVLFFAIALIPILILQGGGGIRQLYLPFALACVGLTISLPRIRQQTLRTSAIVGILAFATAISSHTAASEWSLNHKVAEQCCSDFRRLVDSEADTVLLLTTPRSIGDAPVLSNDSRAALFFCSTRKFGYEMRIVPIAEMAMAIPIRAERTAGPEAKAVFARKMARASGWFVHPKIADSGAGFLSILEPGPSDGESTAFSYTAPERAPNPRMVILEFNGSGFSRIETR